MRKKSTFLTSSIPYSHINIEKKILLNLFVSAKGGRRQQMNKLHERKREREDGEWVSSG